MRYILPFKLIFLFSFLCFLFLTSCENKVSTPERIINQPGSVEASGSGNSITVKFYGNNIEEGFRGYNIYVGKNPGIINQGLSPVLNYFNSKPTLPYGSVGCFPDASAKSSIILYKDSSGSPVSNNYNYYVAVTAYIIIGNNTYESPFTETVPVRIKVSETAFLYNQQFSAISNGIAFSNNGSLFYSSPALSDVFFKLADINGTIVPVLSTESNNNSIQDAGYAQSINDPIVIPTYGYLQKSAISVILSHIYILYIPSKNKYVKIHIDRIDGYLSGITANTKLWISYEY